MYVSLHLSPQSRGKDEDLAIVERTLGQAARGERHGAAAICVTEHHLGGFNTYVDPFMFAARLSAELTTASVAVTVARVPMHHPLRLAEQCNLLDLLTHGRSFVALAQGWALPVEEAAFGLQGQDAKRVTDERIEAVLDLLAHDGDDATLTISTSADSGVVAARISPAPFRRRGPLVGRVSTTPSTIAAAAARGLPVLFGVWSEDRGAPLLAVYRDALLGADLEAEVVEDCLAWAGFTVPVIIGRTQAEAEARLADYREVAAAGPHGGPGDLAGSWRAEWTKREVTKLDEAVVGSAERILDEIAASAAAGARCVRIMPVHVAGRPEEHDEIVDMILEEVLPGLDPEPFPVAETVSA